MAWPFSNVVEPNLSFGPGFPIPLFPSVVTAVDCWLLGAHLTNTGAVQRTITLTNAAGTILCQVTIPGGGEEPYEWPFRPVLGGVRWFADGTDCIGHVWGYK